MAASAPPPPAEDCLYIKHKSHGLRFSEKEPSTAALATDIPPPPTPRSESEGDVPSKLQDSASEEGMVSPRHSKRGSVSPTRWPREKELNTMAADTPLSPRPVTPPPSRNEEETMHEMLLVVQSAL